MKDIPLYFGVLAGILSAIAYIPYVRNVLRSPHRPPLSALILWTMASFMLLFSNKAVGADITWWLALAYAIGTLTATLILFRKTKGWDLTDTLCCGVSIISIFLWWHFDDAFIPLVMNLVVDVMGSVAALKKAIKAPELESKTAWKFFFWGALCSLIAMFLAGDYSKEISLYPIVMFLSCGSISYFVFMRPRRSAVKV